MTIEFKKFSELRKEYLADAEGNVPEYSPLNYKNLDDDQLKQLQKTSIIRKYTLEAYAKQAGLVLDPQWSQYSYEEILQMEDNGVLIPKEILEIAHSLQEEDATTYEIEMNEAEQQQALEDQNQTQQEDDTATKKASFFELVGKAAAQIDKCEEKEEQINQKIKDLTPTANETQTLKDKFLNRQKDALAKLLDAAKEWKELKKKADNGKELTPFEQRRFEELSKHFDSENQENEQLGKNVKSELDEITKSLREIDALTQKGEQIGIDTKNVGNELKDSTSKANFKQTRKIVSRQYGPLGAFIAMAKGKKLASEAVSVGGNTENHANDTQISLNEIATILDISKPLSTAEPQKQEALNADTSQAVNKQEIQSGTDDTKNQAEELDSNTLHQEDKLQTTKSNFQSALAVPADGTASGATGEAAPTEGEINSTKVTNSKSKNKKKEEEPEINKGNAKKEAKSGQKAVDNIKKETKEGDKESQTFKKEGEKDEKELQKEEKALLKKIKKDIKQMNRIEKETEKIEKQTEQMIIQYEELNTQNDELVEQAKTQQQNPQAAQTQPKAQDNQKSGGVTGMSISSGSGQQQNGGIEEKIQKIEENNKTINVVGAQFKINNRKIDKNQTTVKKLGKTIKKSNKTYQKTTKLREKKANERVKAEEEKQAKLQKKIAIVGMFENIFGMTTAIGTALTCWPPTVPAGNILINIGVSGTIKCGLTKTIIYAANGMLAQALMTLGTTIISAATAMTGTSGAAQNALGRVTATLQVINSAAKIGSSVREIQGKDPGMLLGSISAITGAASAITGGIQNLSNLGGSALKQASTIASVSGNMISSTSQMISQGRQWAGKDGETALTKIMGFIGTGLSTAGALGQLGTKIQDKRALAKGQKDFQKSQNDKQAAFKEKMASETANREQQSQKQAQAQLAESTAPQQEAQPQVKKTNIVSSRSYMGDGPAPVSEDPHAYDGFKQNPKTNIVSSRSYMGDGPDPISQDPNAYAGFNQSPKTDIVTSTSGTMPGKNSQQTPAVKTANATGELKPTNTEALTGELQGPSDAPIQEAAAAPNVQQLSANAKTQMNEQFGNEPIFTNNTNKSSTFDAVMQGVGSALTVAGQLLNSNDNSNKEEEKAKNTNYKRHKINTRYIRKITKQNEAQRLAFSKSYSQSNSGGFNQKRR